MPDLVAVAVVIFCAPLLVMAIVGLYWMAFSMVRIIVIGPIKQRRSIRR